MVLELGGYEVVRFMFGKELCDGCLVCFGRGCGEGECNFIKVKFEYLVVVMRLVIVVVFWCCLV